jgi:hypothetical protein
MKAIGLACAVAAVGLLCLTGCQTAPKTAQAETSLETQVQGTIRTAMQQDPSLQQFFDRSAGYAVFPSVGAGAAVVGGAFGRGQVFQNGQFVGYTTLTQATVGLSLGGQQYSELIFFQTQDILNKFKTGQFGFTAEASAVALTTGAAAQTSFRNGVAVFTMSQGGLMFSAAVGGQKFSFSPAGTATASAAGSEETVGTPAAAPGPQASSTTR